MPLTAEERRAVLPVAAGLPADLAVGFLRAVDRVLGAGPGGEAVASKTAAKLAHRLVATGEVEDSPASGRVPIEPEPSSSRRSRAVVP